MRKYFYSKPTPISKILFPTCGCGQGTTHSTPSTSSKRKLVPEDPPSIRLREDTQRQSLAELCPIQEYSCPLTKTPCPKRFSPQLAPLKLDPSYLFLCRLCTALLASWIRGLICCIKAHLVLPLKECSNRFI